MSTLSMFDELDEAIDQMIADGTTKPAANGTGTATAATTNEDQQVAALLAVATDLRDLPSQEFQARLKAELLWAAQKHSTVLVTSGKSHNHDDLADETAAAKPQHIPSDLLARLKSSADGDAKLSANGLEIMPTLFGKGYGAYPVRQSNFVVSVALHLAALSAMMTVFWMAQHTPHVLEAKVNSDVSIYMPPGSMQPHGGGGGGDHSMLPASKGTVKTAPEQIVPPTAHSVLPSRLTAEETVVAPMVKLPESDRTGLIAGAIVPSNGTGASSGIGAGSHGGAGVGDGNGIGIGHGGGIGGGVFSVGNGVSAPRVVFDPDPEYSEEARKAHFQGTVVVWAIVDADGHVRSPRVQRSIGLGLDEKALEAVKTWRFDPATKDGRPVPVAISIEVGFRLY